MLEGQAAAADALGEPGAQTLELRDPLVDTPRPAFRQPGPIGALRHLVPRQLGQLGGDVLERQSDPLCEHDEGHAS